MSSAASDLPQASGAMHRTPLRFVTAASLFDGHDAAINIMRRLIQARGAEVIHLGHNRSVDDIVRAAIQEDADGIAISSYQGGHNEFFRYMVDRLREGGAGHIKVFGGGGGTITPDEIRALMAYGVERIYHPHDGMELGLDAMIDDLVLRTERARRVAPAMVAGDGAATIDDCGNDIGHRRGRVRRGTARQVAQGMARQGRACAGGRCDGNRRCRKEQRNGRDPEPLPERISGNADCRHGR